VTSYVDVTHSASVDKPELRGLTRYRSSEGLVRYFCSTCGTHVYVEYCDDGHFEAATGTLQVDSAEGVVEYKSCVCIADTRDGGASDWLSSIAGYKLERWAGNAAQSERVPLHHYTASKREVVPARTPTRAHCHCNGVEFWISHPTAAARLARSDFPDLLTPYQLGEAAARNPSNTSWWLRDDNTRFLAGTCACISCRRASGFDITFWAFVPTACIFLDACLTAPFPAYGAGHANAYWGTMKAHTSSAGVTRTFCGRCGASIFWDGGEEKGRFGLVDVAVGLLDAESGARAEELLAWCTERVSFEEFAVDKRLARALSEGLEGWERCKGNRI
jgi:hypothetical protein